MNTRIIKEATCKSSSGQSNLTHYIGTDEANSGQIVFLKASKQELVISEFGCVNYKQNNW